jgi:hypothetical protein
VLRRHTGERRAEELERIIAAALSADAVSPQVGRLPENAISQERA